MDKSVRQPIMAARITLGLTPTNQTNPIIISIVSNEATRLLTNRRSVVMLKPDKMEMFMPESAIIWSVPVVVRASRKSFDSVALVPNKIPANNPA